MTIVVFGSINLDLVVEVSRLPSKGETVIGNRFFSAAGGKAANQAVAIAKLGTPVSLVGQVGGDRFGQTLLENLSNAGVNIEGVTVNPHTHSGVASIVVDEKGDNTIACAAGANNLVREEEVKKFRGLLSQSKVVLMELGIPLATVLAAAREARANNCFTILDPAPAMSNLPDELYRAIDLITPNEIEASQLVGFTVDGVTTARQAAFCLHQMGVKNVIVTLGSQGAFCSSATDSFWVEPISVSVVDTVAAGDAFNGALAVAIASGKSLAEAVRWGTVAGALAVTKNGAQTSLPNLDRFKQLLAQTFL
ncbi:ribokinase [Myxosarcina sp. GI1]|uniref:ribokinase n=1 Tax=Myxosarcina sp. GI1 TaxID=1541065 RepID=UPI000568A76D|nr:ribokinase [Myxosarcina sp. GI1]